MICNPNVTSSGTSRFSSTVRLRITRCNAQPKANRNGSAISMAQKGGMKNAVDSARMT